MYQALINSAFHIKYCLSILLRLSLVDQIPYSVSFLLHRQLQLLITFGFKVTKSYVFHARIAVEGAVFLGKMLHIFSFEYNGHPALFLYITYTVIIEYYRNTHHPKYLPSPFHENILKKF